jgi:hypothetical protein
MVNDIEEDEKYLRKLIGYMCCLKGTFNFNL